MPATLTGRGAQVVVDPLSNTAKAMRGAYATTFEANAAKVAAECSLVPWQTATARMAHHDRRHRSRTDVNPAAAPP